MAKNNAPTKTELKILRFLADNDKSFGLAICKATKIFRGSIYVLLARTENKGLIVSHLEDNPADDYKGIPRRLYCLTDEGRKFL